MKTIESIEYFYKINDKLSTSGQPTESEVKLIAEEGFEIVINARPQSEMDELFNEREIVGNLGMKYFQIETELNDPNMDELINFLELMTKFREKKVFLHCRVNRRVSGLLAIYRVIKLGWNEADALNEVKKVWEITPELQNFIEVQIDYLADE
ncbi:MAG: protein tyrosine phosphatase family protein [Melioribacteraceae bacterium]|nr:protein tyrosine phosphatase family protein [Melioribacteraceae bacterium]